MNKSLSAKSTTSQAVDAPGCDANLVNLENVRQVQPEIVLVEKVQQIAEFFETPPPSVGSLTSIQSAPTNAAASPMTPTA